MPFEHFAEDVCWIIRDIVTDAPDEFIADHSEYVYVDGEEGDWGRITYSDKDGKLVATHLIYGGDRDEWVFTEFGCDLFCGKMIMALLAATTKMKKEIKC